MLIRIDDINNMPTKIQKEVFIHIYNSGDGLYYLSLEGREHESSTTRFIGKTTIEFDIPTGIHPAILLIEGIKQAIEQVEIEHAQKVANFKQQISTLQALEHIKEPGDDSETQSG